MQKIIVTADDYGMCDAVDTAIEAGMANGIITTTNVMTNMESLHHAGDLRQRFPHVSVGVHWNVTTGKPVCDPAEVPSLVDENGVFWPIGQFKKRFSKGLISADDLRRELEAQYTLFAQTCGAADYWNTHENSSLHTKAFYVFADVARAHGIPATRTFQRVYYDKKGLSLKTELREILVRHFFHFWFERIRKSFTMPSARVVSFDKISKTEGNVLLNALKKDGRDFIEVVFHPAVTADHPFFGNISDERVKEYEFLASKDVFEAYTNSGIEFVNFDAINNCR